MNEVSPALLRRVLLAVGVLGICWIPVARAGTNRHAARVMTDGRLRVGHFETIRARGFPGKGVLDISFFPTAICEDGCGANSYSGWRTNANGVATFKVRVPGTFFDFKRRPTYFRDGERIAVEVTWSGPDDSFVPASAEPEPILVRTHARRHG